MVSPHLTSSNKNQASKQATANLLFPMSPHEPASNDNLELEFTDVFGPLPGLDMTEESHDIDANEVLYEDPVVVHNRSHSLVGPTLCVSRSLKLSKLTLCETNDPLEHLESLEGQTIKETEHSGNNSESEELAENYEADGTKLQPVGIDDFEVLKLVGQGAFGKVFQVRKKGTLEIYAMKVMRKDKIMDNNHADYMKAERDILTKVDHPFVVQLKYSFQTKYRLYLVLDFVNGGHLFFQLYQQGLFREELARVYAAELVSAVSHLHRNGIMHRDLKPENILLDADGHVKLTDFGLAKEFDENTRANSMCGTCEYMAPEIIVGKGHDKAADWWSIGILLYEMLTGKPPFLGNRQKIQQKIIKEKVKLPSYLTDDAHSLLKKLLEKDPRKRLGSGSAGSDEIKRHKWFKPVNWKKLEEKKIQPSFLPEVGGKLCTANFDKIFTDMPLLDSPAASPKTDANPFVDFTYVRPLPSFLGRSQEQNDL